jgi:SAM-dependent methyltransferase
MKYERDYNLGMDARGMPLEGRGLSEYERSLMFSREELRGKTVLDLGSGPLNKFSEELKGADIEANVIALSPAFFYEEKRTKARENSPEGNMVAGLGQELPFKEGSFDYIFALHVFDHTSMEIRKKMILEVAKALKEGGVAKFGPTQDTPGEPNTHTFQRLEEDRDIQKVLAEQGVELIREDIPESILPKVKVKDGYANAFYMPRYNIVLRKATS